jgi:hypothetical protein
LWRHIHQDQASDYIQELSEEVYSTSYKFRVSIASAVTAEFGVDCLPRHLTISRANIENAAQACVASIVGRSVSRFEENAQFCLAIIRHQGIIVAAPNAGLPENQFANACVAWNIMATNNKLVVKLIPSKRQRKIARILASRYLSIGEISTLSRLIFEAYGQGSFPRLRHFWLYGI